ncbi:uncharacterized protein LOC125863683 [Solanum stenotomum]|uniref:uncharacterized protein LOC125863683 n=1 Tax=Solanum stenotomum TaxID=172797 RepID=UPI0020D1F458|nr:uncharacterized protein LOC125863683 [Solanum stenotomum]
MHRCHVQAQLFRCFMLREVEGSSTDAIMIYINGTTLRFTHRDFCLVSGLKCSDDCQNFVFNIEEPNRILQMYFKKKKSISKAEFVQSFNNKVWGDNVDDALKFGILYFIHSYILSEESISTTIERIDFDLVESGMYMDYPWDNKAFEELTKNIHGKMKRTGKYYRIHGFPIAMQITFRNITPTPLKIAIIPLPLEYVQSDTASPSIPPSNIEANDVIQSPDSDDDFQDPSKSINNKGQEKVVSNSDILSTKKMVRQSVPAIPKKIPPKVVQDHDIKRPQTRNAQVSPSVKTGITTSNNDSSQINIFRAEFDLFNLSVKEEFTNLRKLIQDNFNIVLNAINIKKSTAKDSDLEVPPKYPIEGMPQPPIQSPSSSSELQRSDEMNNLENNEKLIKSKTVGQSLKVLTTDELSSDDTILEHVSQDLPPEYQVDPDFMYDHLEVNKNSVDVLVNDEYVPDQIEDVQKQDSTVGVDQLDDNMQNAKEHIICVAPIQMLSHVDASYNRVLTESPILIPGLQLSRLNPKRSIVLHSGAGVMDETPIHQIRRPERYNTSPYITTFKSSSGSSSKLPIIFDQKHPFDSISGTHDTSLYTNFWKWLREAYTEFLSDGNGISKGPFDPNLMHSKNVVLLWNYGMLKIQAEAISDSEAPDKPIRSNVDVDSSERITII